MPINSFLYPGPSNSNPYLVDNSLRFNSGSSDYLSKSASSGNTQTATFSAWIKKATNGTTNRIFTGFIDSNNFTNIYFRSTNDELVILHQDSGSNTIDLKTAMDFKDPSAWFHIVVAFDLSNGTEADRVKIYANGVQLTNFDTATYPSNSDTIDLNNSSATNNLGLTDGTYFSGYMAEVCLIGGTAYAASNFGEFDSDTPTIWKPKDVSGLTFGTNGFYLQFKQTGTSANSSGIGADTSGNDSHFTVNNLTAVDQSTDTCTNNFATMNPLAVTNAGNTFTEGNLKITTTSGASSYNQATIGVSSGKWYWEIKYVSDTDGSNNYARIGIADINPPNTGGLGETEGIAYEAINGKYKIRGSATSYGDTYAPGDIISVALNLDDNELIFYKNGTAQNSGTAIDISSYTSKTGFWHPAFNYDDGSNSGVFEANFGSPSFAISSGNADANGYGNFEYSVPTNYYSLCTKNLAEFGG
jgi:hypothetical protein